MKRTVGELKLFLADIPNDWECWAYEGEVIGVVVHNPDDITYDGANEKVFDT